MSYCKLLQNGFFSFENLLVGNEEVDSSILFLGSRKFQLKSNINRVSDLVSRQSFVFESRVLSPGKIQEVLQNHCKKQAPSRGREKLRLASFSHENTSSRNLLGDSRALKKHQLKTGDLGVEGGTIKH